MRRLCVFVACLAGFGQARGSMDEVTMIQVQHAAAQSPTLPGKARNLIAVDDEDLIATDDDDNEEKPDTYPGEPPSPAPELMEDEEIVLAKGSDAATQWPTWVKQKRGLRLEESCEDWDAKVSGGGCKQSELNVATLSRIAEIKKNNQTAWTNLTWPTTFMALRSNASFLTGKALDVSQCCLNMFEGLNSSLPPWWNIPGYIALPGYFLVDGYNVNPVELWAGGAHSKSMEGAPQAAYEVVKKDDAVFTTLLMAKYLCFKAPSCVGFTHRGSEEEAQKKGKVWVYFKSWNMVGYDFNVTHATWPTWTSYAVPKGYNGRYAMTGEGGSKKAGFRYKSAKDRSPPPHP